ncbi:MAG: glycosyltransferase [Leptospiraceae bacterium]|nr:glycosyltransferase [Leptospiraceae bacterium]
MKKILLFSKYGEWEENSYYRYFHYIPNLKKNNFELKPLPFFSQKANMSITLEGRVSLVQYILAYIKRLYNLLKRETFHGAIVDLELFPYIPFGIENLFFSVELPVILDIYNGDFHKYSNNSHFLHRHILSDKIPLWIARSEAVLVSNFELEEFVKTWNANSFTIPFAFQKDYLPIQKESFESHEILIGWSGSFYTSNYLKLIFEPLRELKRFFPLKLFLLGGNSDLNYPIKTEIIDYKKEIELSLLSKVDIAIHPLQSTLREKDNPCLDVLKYMYLGLPVVSTWNNTVKLYIENSENGFLAKTTDDWYLYLRMLIEDETLRKEMGSKAKAKAEAFFSPQQGFERLLEIFRKVF